MRKEQVVELLNQYVSGTLSGEGWRQLSQALDDPETIAYLDEELLMSFLNDEFYVPETEESKTFLNNQILDKIRRISEKDHLAEHPMVVAKKRFMSKWHWAAAAIIFFIAGSILWHNWPGAEQQSIVKTDNIIDIPPGKNGAILKLSNGTEMVLDSLSNGVIAKQPGAEVVLKDGRLLYNTGAGATEKALNTMTTPRGRQFQLTLPDGTRVWLNASSSITYPVLFTGNSRTVQVTGEAYFEVAKMNNMPFKVSINNSAEVEVLGTHFNINAYDNEEHIKTTLLEGSVKTRFLTAQETITLKPGQQAEMTASKKIKLNEDVNTDQVMAWKNGLFNFDNASLEEVMRQLSRWYDITVVYPQGVPKIIFGGEMNRNISLTGVLNGLQRAGVHFQLEEGARLVVMP